MTTPAVMVAGLSSRMMAESAAQAGLRVIALDLFGDVDTRHMARHWESIGAANAMAIDGDYLLAALRRQRRTPGLLGWVTGSGFEASPGLLDAGAAFIPLLGNRAATVLAVKQPEAFFRLLSAQGIPHPETRTTPPPQADGWLRKQTGGCGGSHIRSAAAPVAPASGNVYFQRIHPGVPMSALFVANRHGAEVIGISHQRIASRQGYPYLFQGAAGPVMLPAGAIAQVREIVHCIAQETSLVGLNSIDFLYDAPTVIVLEVNPRPPASMALYADAYPRGLMHAHVQACTVDRPVPPPTVPPTVPTAVARGFEVVLAPAALHVGAALTSTLLRTSWCHDIPVPGTCVAAGSPFCSVSATGDTMAAMEATLRQRLDQIQSQLKTRHDELRHATGISAARHVDACAERQRA